MSADAAREFVDANVFVYAYDETAGQKKLKAERLITRLWDAGAGCLSIQVLQEFFVTITRKVAKPLSVPEAADRVGELAVWTTFAPTTDDVLKAIGIHRDARIGFWDAMIVHAAAELGCEVLWSEDLQDGRLLRGVRIRNPFVDSPLPNRS